MSWSASRFLVQCARLKRLLRIPEWQSMLAWAVVAGLVGTAATEAFRLLLH